MRRSKTRSLGSVALLAMTLQFLIGAGAPCAIGVDAHRDSAEHMTSMTGDMMDAQMGHVPSGGDEEALSTVSDEESDHGTCVATMTCVSVFSVARGQSPPTDLVVRQTRVTTAQWSLHGSSISGLTPPPRA